MDRLHATVVKTFCLRCRKSVETMSTDDIETHMVFIAHNLYYCPQCADATGHPGKLRGQVGDRVKKQTTLGE
ncbi:hypothetical protein EDB81DRAFT_672890 [Dactylonectria macrodidyma]|uniref:Uncharacterized protein n=1 Tax=Dactylonectria macrodidyma TaxID=307937 RepID=A0A9P9I6A1_9HYPO|nr:hypothetical protein EDB81DRAFT_672890 [Dactylonectria macrodidyma]